MMIYTASAKETFDEIALHVYGDEKYAYLLLQKNPTLVDRIMMQGGETILAPDMPEDAASELPPWKRG